MMRTQNDMTSVIIIGLFVLTCFFSNAHGIQDYSDLPKGPYCAAKYERLNCCGGRQDECSAPILTTTCYCDDFCNRTQVDDCCPDYWSHCKGIEIDIPPASIIRCYFRGRYYNEGETSEINCNKCKCTSVDGVAEMLCERNRCLVEADLLDDINLSSSRLGWRAENHTEFWGRSLDDGIKLRLGTLSPSKSVMKMNPIHHSAANLPREFDARTQWEDMISEIRDQGWCGASWALSTVDVASDRYGIMSMGREAVQLSAQHLISCNNRGQQGCHGGYLDKAWFFLKKFGLVDESCYPWTEGVGKCKLRKFITLKEAGCNVPTDPPRTSLYDVSPAHRLGNETDIMQEIRTSGPVQATMKVYQDFFVYKSGVYKHSPLSERWPTGYHSVRIIGWGEELSTYGPPEKYWIVANSWGKHWGENGFFRILRGVNECEIETFVVAAWANTVIKN